jgi:hypothetical protein
MAALLYRGLRDERWIPFVTVMAGHCLLRGMDRRICNG